MKFIVIIDEDEMHSVEQNEFIDQLRSFVHGEWWSQFSATVIGPINDDEEDLVLTQPIEPEKSVL
jgi:hypothetical protein